MTKIAKAISVVGILILLVIIYLFFEGVNREIRRFEDRIGISLPKGTKIIFSEETYGPLGDGERLNIYQISSEGLKNLEKQIKGKNWVLLPINSKLSAELRKIVGASSKAIASKMNLDFQKGYYFFEDRFVGFRANTDFPKFTISIINAEESKVYFYTFDR